MADQRNTETRDDGPPRIGGDVEVLLVDDDEAWVESTAELLGRQRAAFDVTTAPDLATARELLAGSDYDCVVCDYDLGSGTGIDLLADLRERGDDRPFVLITGQGDETVASEAIGRQVTDYIPKRSLRGRDDLLARRIESAVETYRTRRALARERRSKEAMLDIVTATSSREELASAFCDHLVEHRGYECAWLGTVETGAGIVLQAAAGVADYPREAVPHEPEPATGTEPALRAVATREPCVVAPIAAGGTEPDGDGWRTIADGHGFEAAAAVPMEHEGTVLGVLAVYATEVDVDRAELDLLAEFGEVAAYALRSAEWKESLLSASPVAVEVELADDRVPLVAVAGRLPESAKMTVLTAVPQSGQLRYVLRVEGVAAAELRRGVADVETAGPLTVVRPGSPLRCDLVVAAPTPETVLAEHGGRTVDAVVEHGTATVTARTAEESGVEPLVEAVRAEYPDAGVRSVRATPGTETAADEGLLDPLTEKQRRALELAFYEGYFERPREHDTTEVAEKFGVSRATFTQHLRAGERKLLAAVLDADGPD